MDAIIRTVKEFILTKFLPGEDPQSLTTSTPLISSGILDSLATLDLVAFLEDTYGIELAAHETDASRIGTLADIAKLVTSKGVVA
ncbi:MAG: acyl carrier protein [bacterium]